MRVSSEYGGRTSRIWAYERLIEAFENVEFNYFDIKSIDNREVIYNYLHTPLWPMPTLARTKQVYNQST